jgi:ribosomal-protein-alanine N-acetyltransferase
MSHIHELRTERLLLRQWKPEDRRPFAAMNADPLVMQYFPNTLTGADSDAVANRFEAHIEQRGHGFWAAELLESGQFIGFVGIKAVPFEAHFTPATEVGWRLARLFWNQGYATEAARAATAFGLETLKLREIVAFTAGENARSRRVMEKLGMTHNPADDFDHPSIEPGHPLRRHVLYRLNCKMPLSLPSTVGQGTCAHEWRLSSPGQCRREGAIGPGFGAAALR